jgi:hypothetical protein
MLLLLLLHAVAAEEAIITGEEKSMHVDSSKKPVS